MRVLLAVEDAAGAQLLRRLVAGPDELVAVLARPRPDGAGASTWSTAKALGVPVWPVDRLHDPDLPADIRTVGADVLLNAYSLVIVPVAVLDALPLGGWNLHPGPLPRYAGLHSVSWAVYHGETEHGVTVHRMTSTVDLGDIAYQACFPVGRDDTALQVASRCVALGLPLLERLAAALRDDPASVPTVRQDPIRRTFFGMGPPDGGRIPWAASADQVVDLVRASDFAPLPSPWGSPTSTVRGVSLSVLKASRTGRATDRPPGSVVLDGPRVLVACGDDWIRLDRLRVDGRATDPSTILHPEDRFDV